MRALASISRHAGMDAGQNKWFSHPLTKGKVGVFINNVFFY
jgi:hypothetical protein